MILVGLAGRAGSGKTTCARWLTVNYGATEYSLAGPLKLVAKDVFGFSDDQVCGDQAAKEAVDPRYGFSPRETLIRLGDSLRRRVSESIWVDALMAKLAKERPKVAVVSDVRYLNEAQRIQRFGGSIVLLSCPNSDSTVDPDAPSEKSVDEIRQAGAYDYWIDVFRSADGAELKKQFKEHWQVIQMRAASADARDWI